MTFSDIRKKEGRISGLTALERILPRRIRATAKKIIFLVLPFVLMLLYFFEEQALIPIEALYAFVLFGTAAWLVIFMLDSFYYAHYFEGAHVAIHEWGIKRHEQTIPFEILEIVAHTHAADLTEGFVKSKAGADILQRLNVSYAVALAFLHGTREKVYADPVFFDHPLTLSVYTKTVFDIDKDFSAFLASHEIARDDLIGTASWVSALYERRKEMFRWWGRDSLGRIKAVGKEWARSETAFLERYGTFVKPQEGDILFKKEIDELEWTLAREAATPTMLVADRLHKLMGVLSGLSSRIEDGLALPQIAHKEILVLDINAIDEAATDTGQFELLMTELFTQALESGQIIVAFNNFPAFLIASKKHGLDSLQFIEPYLNSPDLSIVAFALDTLYEKYIASEPKLLKHFARIFVECEDAVILLRVLEHKVFDIERQSHLLFTYQAIKAIAERASVDSNVNLQENQATVLLSTLLPRLIARDIRVVTAEHVAELLD